MPVTVTVTMPVTVTVTMPVTVTVAMTVTMTVTDGHVHAMRAKQKMCIPCCHVYPFQKENMFVFNHPRLTSICCPYQTCEMKACWFCILKKTFAWTFAQNHSRLTRVHALNVYVEHRLHLTGPWKKKVVCPSVEKNEAPSCTAVLWGHVWGRGPEGTEVDQNKYHFVITKIINRPEIWSPRILASKVIPVDHIGTEKWSKPSFTRSLPALKCLEELSHGFHAEGRTEQRIIASMRFNK